MPIATGGVRKPASMTIFLVIGGLAFAVMAGIAGFLTFQRYEHSRHWTPTPATVTWQDELCQMSYKSGKSWHETEPVDCAEVEAYKLARPDRSWSSTRRNFVDLAYTAAGAAQTLFVAEYQVSAAPTRAGAVIEIFVDPSDPQGVDRALAAADFRMAALVVGMGAGIFAFLVGIGFLIRRRARRQALEAGGASPA